jgi:hypothetical protein
MHDLALWLASTSISRDVQRILWIIPLLQSIHILAIAMVLSSVVMVEARILGLVHSQTLSQTAHRFVPWLWTGLVLLALTGLVLIIGEPRRTLDNNPAFLLKMVLLAFALAVTLAFQGSLRRNLAFWEDKPQRNTLTTVLAVVALVLWCAVAVAGRWIAYVREG